MKIVLALLILASGLFPVPMAVAASFDCTAAETDFETTICADDALSQADETLARAYETALGGLTDSARDAMRTDQRDWLKFAQRSCIALPTPQSPITPGECLLSAFDDRIETLEQSRMIGGHRFYVATDYAAGIDPNAEPDTYWRISEHSFTMPLIDEDNALANGFNALVDTYRDRSWENADRADVEDVSVDLRIHEVTDTRITLSDTLYWYGHGAAHPNHSTTYIHYLVDAERELRAEDIFAGDGWQDELRRLSAEALRREHGDALFDDFEEGIADLVIDPARWLFDDRGLIVQFNPYDVAAYAYGAPQVTIRWEDLQPLLAEGANAIRWGIR